MQSMQMPDEYKDAKMNIICNDCLTSSLVPFHIAGAKCTKCGSYNTSRTNDYAIHEAKKQKLTHHHHNNDTMVDV